MELPVPLATARLVLRTLTAADATPRYLGWMHDPDVMRYLEARFATHTFDSLRAFIEGCNRNPADLLLGICEPDGRHVGNIKLGPVNPHHGHASVGLLIGERDCWGRGYAAEAIGALTGHAFRALGLHKLYAGCYGSNVGSQRAFLKAGWADEGRAAGMWECEGRREDNLVLGITRAQWSARQP